MLKIKLSIVLMVVMIKVVGQPCGQCGTKKHEKFRLLSSEGLHIDTNKIKNSGVYINKYSWENGTKTYSFIRFFNNGKVFISCEYCKFPTASDFSNFSHGRYGEYKIEGDLLKIESHGPYSGYYFGYYEIKADTITIKYAKLRRRVIKSDKAAVPELKYVFRKMD